MSTILYPRAVWSPLLNHSAPGKIENRDLIVLHITEGRTASSAIATFEASKAPHRVSAHFVIDRDGTVIQLLDIQDTAWHASQVNSRSIGIEHAALSPQGAAALNKQHADSIATGHIMPFVALPATELQYCASAELVAWLCGQLNIPCDREHVRAHNEVSPADGHTLCCTGALDPDRVVRTAQGLAR